MSSQTAQSIKDQLRELCRDCTTLESLKVELEKIYEEPKPKQKSKAEKVHEELEKIRQQWDASRQTNSDQMKCINDTIKVSKQFEKVTFHPATRKCRASVVVTVDGDSFMEDDPDVYQTMMSLCGTGYIKCSNNAND